MILAKAKYARYRELAEWMKSIIHHFRWSSVTCLDDSVTLKEKWASVLHHVSNIHEWKKNDVVHACEHDPLDNEETGIKKWLTQSSPSHSALKEIVTDTKVLGDLPYLTKFSHSGELEVLHVLCNVYCPKRLAFSCPGMYAPTQLAVM